MHAKAINRKLTLVGPSWIGKTTLLLAALQGRYPPAKHAYHTPRDYECVVSNEAQVNPEILVNLTLWDTAGVFDFDRLSPLKYSRTNVVVIAFAIDRPDYFDLTDQTWLKEVEFYAPGVPIVLAGLRKDTRDYPSPDGTLQGDIRFVSKELGEEMARRIGAVAFVECSSQTGEGVREVFEAAGRAAVFGPQRKISWKISWKKKKEKCKKWARWAWRAVCIRF